MTNVSSDTRPSPAVRTLRHDASARPFLVIWECTRACPLACRHCRAEAQLQRQPGELAIDEAADLAGQVASFGNPPPLFVITGGDPFARDDIFEIVRAAKEKGLAVAVSPSGTSALTAARELGLRVQINTTISRHNLRDLPTIVKLVALRGVMTWSAFFLVPTGRGRQLEIPRSCHRRGRPQLRLRRR